MVSNETELLQEIADLRDLVESRGWILISETLVDQKKTIDGNIHRSSPSTVEEVNLLSAKLERYRTIEEIIEMPSNMLSDKMVELKQMEV